MSIIYNKIKYDHQQYSQLTDPAGKRAIEQLAELLKSIEADIVNDPDGQIAITKSGYIYIDGFHPNVAKKLTKILGDR